MERQELPSFAPVGSLSESESTMILAVSSRKQQSYHSKAALSINELVPWRAACQLQAGLRLLYSSAHLQESIPRSILRVSSL